MAKRLKRGADDAEAGTDPASAPAKKKGAAPAPKISARSKQMSKAIKSIDGFMLFEEVERPVIVPTRITSLNRALRCGGFPCQMLGVLHGPSQGGKTLLLAEIMHAAWAAGGWALFVDAESRAVDKKWYLCVIGNLGEVIYYRPKTFEDTIIKVEEFRAKFRAAKEAGEVHPDAPVVVGIDSINRLTPSNELKELLEGKAKERGYPIRALMTSKWLDKLIPDLGRDESIVFIQRESTNIGAQPGQKTWQVKGGRAVTYDGGWILRIEATGAVKADEEKKRIGEKHGITVMKNSMGPHVDEEACFYSSAGKDGTPLGFDFIREVREEAIARGLLVYKSGTGYLYHGEKVASSKKELPKWLGKDGNWERLAEELNADADCESPGDS